MTDKFDPDVSEVEVEPEVTESDFTAEPGTTNLETGNDGPVDELTESEVTEAEVVLNTGYVAVEDQEDEVFDVVRDGGSDGERREVTQSYMYANHLNAARQADPYGVYLDDVQRRKAEMVRAKQEGREPDLENPPPGPGDVLVPVHMAAQHSDVKVVSEVELTTVVGDYERDENGEPVNA